MSGDERTSASPMTVKEAVRRARREAGRLRDARTVLERLRAALPAPSPEELAQVERGECPPSAEAYLLGVLQAAISELEDVEEDLRYAVAAKTLSRLERDWRRGALTNELPWIRSALSARNV